MKKTMNLFDYFKTSIASFAILAGVIFAAFKLIAI